MLKDPFIGRLVDSRYEIIDRIARGGMATVYLAKDRRLDRQVAFKVIHAHLADSPDFVARFRREARAAARLSNPGVVAVYDQGSIDGIAYLVMELVQGSTLRDLIATGSLSVKETLELGSQILRPLGAAHRSGLIHRDVKPENVLLPADGSAAKVADFGLARAVTEATQTTGNILGTVAYLAPELITEGLASPRADVYSVGIIIYEMLTGVQPFLADSPIQVAFRNVHEDVPAPSLLIPELPDAVDALVADMTQRNPQKRLADADAALAELRNCYEHLTAAQLLVKRGTGTGQLHTAPLRTQTAANTFASTPALKDDGSQTSRTVSLPIGSIGLHTAPTPATAKANDTVVVADPTAKPQLRRRLVLGVGVVALLGAGASGAWYLTAGPGKRVTVPNLVGMSQADAQAAITKINLTWGASQRAYSDTVAAGAVISTDPQSGTAIQVGSTVVAVISRGIEQKAVPDVVNKTQEEASQALTEAGLALGTVSQDYSDTVAAGAVISSDPAAGTMINHSSPVAIVISAGRQPTTIPDVTGMSLQAATDAITAAGLSVSSSSEEFSDTVDSGLVISSDPAAGATGYFHGDAMSLVISKGPQMVTIPEVVSKSESEARKILEAAGLVVSVNRVLGGLFGTARSTDPQAGTSVRKGSTVTLYVV